MEQQLTGSGTGEPDLTEEIQAAPEPAAEAPALNRADRRAQAKGKKAGPNPNLPASGGAHGPSGRTSGHAGQVRFPRTGHK